MNCWADALLRACRMTAAAVFLVAIQLQAATAAVPPPGMAPPAVPPAATSAIPLPENLAAKATATASSEHNQHYLASFAIDGRIPPAGSRTADRGAAWCVLKARSGDQAQFTLQWSQPIEAAEVVYYGRTSWFMNECWKDYELYLDDRAEPAVKGTLKMIHGPQRIKLPPGKVQKITLKFLNSYGGYNPGAAEIMVFAISPTDEQLAAITAAATTKVALHGGFQVPPELMPPIDRPNREHLLALIRQLIDKAGACHPSTISATAAEKDGPHGGAAGAAPGDGRSTRNQVAERLAALAAEAASATPEQLVHLQRRVLLYDVDRLLVVKRYEIEASHVYTYHYEGQRNGGGLYIFDVHQPHGRPIELVSSPNGQILDADLSYDGQQVVFSWRRGKQGYHIFKINIDGTGLVQLTDGPWHDYNPCWLPDGGIAFLSTRQPQFAYCWDAPVGILYRMNADGSAQQRLSANYLNDFTPAVLEDGRIIYTRWEYVDRPAIPIQSLWTINPDGTRLAGYFGNRVLSPGTFMEARPVPGTSKIICTMTGHNGPTRGAIGLIDRSYGVNSQQAIVNLTPDTPVPPVNKGDGNTHGPKPYCCPLPLDDLRFLVSARGPVLVRTIDGRCQSTALPGPDDGMAYFSAQPVRPRPRPPIIPSSLPQQCGEETAVLFLQDVYNGLEPYVRRGEVKRIRVVRELHKPLRIDPGKRAFGFQFPVISCGATYAAKQVLGEVPVEPDGSACFVVPAGVPIYFMALDEEGRAVQRMRSFTHLMPGEVQGCIGCHEERLHASRPQLPQAAALHPKKLDPMEWGSDGFDYSRIVQPVWDKYCIQCHNPFDLAGGLDLTGGKTDFFNVSYEMLARERWGPRGSPYVSWIPTYNGQEQNILWITPKTWGSPASKLAEVIRSGHPDQQGTPRFQMDEVSRRRVFAWIDLNVPYYGTSETAYPENVGCRQIIPSGLQEALQQLGVRRCAECHNGGKFPQREWVRIIEPELNPFLLAPLAREAGGTQKCGRAVFQDKNDPDYQAILGLFKPVQEMLARRPRMDMPGAQPDQSVSRLCQ